MNSDFVSREFPGARGYLNSASIGLPPTAAVTRLHAAISEWQDGKASAPGYDDYVEDSRRHFARIVDVPPKWVAIGSQVSALVGMVATALPPGSRVVCPDGEFTSVLFPMLARDDITVDLVDLDEIAAAIGPQTDLVAFSLVQSADGRVADGGAISAAAQQHGALTLVDATQAAGWLPLDSTRYDVTVTGAYKWLMSPRGTAFMTVRPEAMDRLALLYPGWYAGESPWDSIYGPPLRLASDARRFDLSPGWLAWVGTAVALRVLVDVGVEKIHQHNVGLANNFRNRVGLDPSNSAIVSIDLPASTDMEQLQQFSTATRAGKLRVGFHLYNTDNDVDRLAAALGV
jgi:selenocysteine lyase/cysteine desulfurase